MPIPGVSGLLDEDGSFAGTDRYERSAAGMLDELAVWADALKATMKNATAGVAARIIGFQYKKRFLVYEMKCGANR